MNKNVSNIQSINIDNTEYELIECDGIITCESLKIGVANNLISYDAEALLNRNDDVGEPSILVKKPDGKITTTGIKIYKENNDESLFQFVEYDDTLALYQRTNIPEPQKIVVFSQGKSLWSENIKIGTPNNNTTLYVSYANVLVSRDINSISDILVIKDGDANISCKSVVFVDDEVEVLNLSNVKEIHWATTDPTTNIIVKRDGNNIITGTFK